jgi:hypothetical protein
MSDAAFPTGRYPAFTTSELESFLADGRPAVIADAMRAEIARRHAVAAGDVSQMTPGERLRYFRSGAA